MTVACGQMRSVHSNKSAFRRKSYRFISKRIERSEFEP